MVGVRIAFDVTLPCKAAHPIATGDKTYATGDAFPWREIGITVDTLYAFWTSGLVRFEPAAIPARAPQPPAPQHQAQPQHQKRR